MIPFLICFIASLAWAESPTLSIDTISGYSEEATVPYSPRGGVETETKQCGKGTYTVLQCTTQKAKIPQHDVDLGRTTISLRTNEGKELKRVTLSEIWKCEGFSSQTRQYLLTTVNEHGTKILLRAVEYLDEASGEFKESQFNDVQFEALSATWSPQRQYLALIGAPNNLDKKIGLYVLNTHSNHLHKLGDAPAPPPLSADAFADKDRRRNEGPWIGFDRHFTELGTEIWHFKDEHTLSVSYGPDTLKGRAKKRKTRDWDLSKVAK